MFGIIWKTLPEPRNLVKSFHEKFLNFFTLEILLLKTNYYMNLANPLHLGWEELTIDVMKFSDVWYVKLEIEETALVIGEYGRESDNERKWEWRR